MVLLRLASALQIAEFPNQEVPEMRSNNEN